MANPKHNDVLPSLRRVEGQIRGVVKMVEEERYCIDILQQLSAARKALDSAALKILKGHINHCVVNAIHEKQGQKKIDELMETLRRYV